MSPQDTLTAAPQIPSEPGAGWKVFRGDGFTLRYPSDAVLVADTSYPARLAGIAIRGPEITLQSPGKGIGAHTGPSYQLVISSFPNAAGRSAEAWVDSVRRERNNHDMSDDSMAFVRPPVTARVAGLRVLELVPFCGDCQPEEIYFVAPRRIVVVSKLYDLSIPGEQTAQSRLYDAIVSTFRWVE